MMKIDGKTKELVSQLGWVALAGALAVHGMSGCASAEEGAADDVADEVTVTVQGSLPKCAAGKFCFVEVPLTWATAIGGWKLGVVGYPPKVFWHVEGRSEEDREVTFHLPAPLGCSMYWMQWDYTQGLPQSMDFWTETPGVSGHGWAGSTDESLFSWVTVEVPSGGFVDPMPMSPETKLHITTTTLGGDRTVKRLAVGYKCT